MIKSWNLLKLHRPNLPVKTHAIHPISGMMDYRKKNKWDFKKKNLKSENNSSCRLQVWVKVITSIMNVQTEELIKDVNICPCLSTTESVLLDTLRYHQTSYFQTHIIWPRRGRRTTTTSNWRQDSGRWATICLATFAIW